jgi:hypothetical protein
LNILNHPHLLSQGQEGTLPGQPVTGVDALANQLTLNPEELKHLQQKSLESNVNFEKVLSATQKGADPEAVIELLSKEAGPKQTEVNPELQQIVNGQINPQGEKQGQILGQKQSLQQSELQQRVVIGGQEQIQQPVELQNIVKQQPKRKSIFPTVEEANIKRQAAALQQRHETNNHKSIFNVSSRIQGEVQNQQMQQAGPAAMAMNHTKVAPVAGQQQIGQANNLVNLNQFMAKQSPMSQKMAKTQIAKNAYKPVSNSMFQKKIQESLPGVNKMQAQTKLQDIMFAGQNDMMSTQQAPTTLAEVMAGERAINQMTTQDMSVAKPKVMNLTEIQSVNSPDELINKVQDYIIQTKVGKNPEVQMAFHHEDLGQVDLVVNKHDDQVKVAINTQSLQGKEFFTKNQVELLRNLAQSGVQVGDFKVDTSSTSSGNTSDFSGKGQQEFSSFNHGKGQHNSESGQRQQDARRREELWELFQEKEVA